MVAGNLDDARDAPFGELEEYPPARFRAEQETRERAAVQSATDAKWADRVKVVPAEWYSESPPKRDWLLRDSRPEKPRGVLPLGKVGQLIAEGGAGKTMLLCQLAVAIATGSRWLGAFDVAKPGRSLLLLAEEDEEEARRRLHRASRVSGARPPDPKSIVVMPLAGVSVPMLELDPYGNLIETDFLQWLRVYVQNGDFRLVVIDPLSRFAGPKAEIDNAAGTRFVQALESIVLPGTSVLNAHHVNKVSRGKEVKLDSTSGRGASSLVDGARWQCAMGIEYLKLEGPEEQARLGEIVTFAVTKSNYAAKPEPVMLRRDQDHGGALVPLTDEDTQSVETARSRDAKGEAKDAARQAKREASEASEDAVVLRAVAEQPGIPLRDLATTVQARAHCGRERAYVAIRRVADQLEVREGPRKAQLHYPKAKRGTP